MSHRARFVLLLLAALASARSIADDGRSDSSRPKSRTGEVAGASLSGTVSALGTLEPEEVIEVGARVAGQVESLGPDPKDPNKTVDYNTSVEKGAVLAQIDSTLYKIRLDYARAVLATAEANLKLMASRLRVAQVEQQVVRKRLADKLATQGELDKLIARPQPPAGRSSTDTLLADPVAPLTSRLVLRLPRWPQFHPCWSTNVHSVRIAPRTRTADASSMLESQPSCMPDSRTANASIEPTCGTFRRTGRSLPPALWTCALAPLRKSASRSVQV